MRWLGVFIASNHFLARWLFLLAMDTPDSPVAHETPTVHCPVRATSVRPLGFGAVDRWNPLSFAASDSPVTSDFVALTSVRHCSSLFIFAVDR
jgi:hypothetical protein